MAVEVVELYSNLNQLLDDICKFLTDRANYEQLSPIARKHADELISRSKKQLQDIAKIRIDEYDGAYVDMERKSDGSNEEDKNIYSSAEEEAVTTPPVVHPQSNPYANLPAKDLSQDVKFGCLSWKCRFILKFEKFRRIYAGVHDNWLLVYSSEKDCKPLQTFDLKCHKAQPIPAKQSKCLSQDFELVCTLGERKTYYFLALTHKDMLQWISHINRCSDSLDKFHTSSSNDERISETYDMIPETNENENEEEDIYHDIETYQAEVIEPAPKAPDIPSRRWIKVNTPLPPIPNRESYDSISNSSTYDPVQSTASLASDSSFSEDGEDNIYEAFVVRPPQTQSQPSASNRKEIESEEIYENNEDRRLSLQKPKTLAKPVLPSKPKPSIMLKKYT